MVLWGGAAYRAAWTKAPETAWTASELNERRLQRRSG
jgi:hypothetical protein